MNPVSDDNEANPQHAQRIVQRARAVQLTDERAVLIGIDGAAGSGKSTLAQRVSSLLEDAPVVHMDDLLAGWDSLHCGPALLAAQVLVPIHRREAASYRRFDWIGYAYAESVPVADAPVVIVEGCACTSGVARQYFDVCVWLQAPSAERKRRAFARDGDVFMGHWDAWASQEAAIFEAENASGRADVVLSTGR